jgi:hypothetical protein
MIPDSKGTLEPCDPAIQLTAYQDSEHAYDMLTCCSVTGILLLLKNTPIKWISKHQKTVETSMYGLELVLAKVTTELILEYRYMLYVMGAALDDPALMNGENNSIVLNCTMQSSSLRKSTMCVCVSASITKIHAHGK